ncbi:hypothetical protein [Collimonas sp. OK242]|jgi:hypothetical protein|uniref:hypothetical protein n=1 Tax=Collimonas sp. OK242 TaxID=1798195 RepID=UPI000B8737F5|nr:hypothetical protein [Collimonas sp. OK242]
MLFYIDMRRSKSAAHTEEFASNNVNFAEMAIFARQNKKALMLEGLMKPDAGCDLNLPLSARKSASQLKLVRMLPYKTPLNQHKKGLYALARTMPRHLPFMPISQSDLAPFAAHHVIPVNFALPRCILILEHQNPIRIITLMYIS